MILTQDADINRVLRQGTCMIYRQDTYTWLLLLISMLWHRQAIFESKGDKLSFSAECRIRSWEVSDINSPADWRPTHTGYTHRIYTQNRHKGYTQYTHRVHKHYAQNTQDIHMIHTLDMHNEFSAHTGDTYVMKYWQTDKGRALKCQIEIN